MGIRLSLIYLLIGLSLAIRIKKKRNSTNVGPHLLSANATWAKSFYPLVTVPEPQPPPLPEPKEPTGTFHVGQLLGGKPNPPTQEEWTDYNRRKAAYEDAHREYNRKMKWFRNAQVAFNEVVHLSDKRLLADWRGWDNLKSQHWLKDREDVTYKETFLRKCEEVALQHVGESPQELARAGVAGAVLDYFGYGSHYRKERLRAIDAEAREKMGDKLKPGQKEKAMHILGKYLERDSSIVDGRFMPLLEMTLRAIGGLGQGRWKKEDIDQILYVWGVAPERGKHRPKFIHGDNSEGIYGDLRSESYMAKIASLTAEDVMKNKEWNGGKGVSAVAFQAKYNPGAGALDRPGSVLFLMPRGPDRLAIAAPRADASPAIPANVWERRTAPAEVLETLYPGLTAQRAEAFYLLGIRANEFGKEQLRAAYLKAAMECHPDKNLDKHEEATRLFQDVRKAHGFLSYKES